MSTIPPPAILPTTNVVVIPVAIDKYDVPPTNDPEKTRLPTLKRIKRDLVLLQDLFDSIEYRAKGFQMLEPINASASEILKHLDEIKRVLRNRPRQLNALLFWSGHGRLTTASGDLRLATSDCFEPMTQSDGLSASFVVGRLVGPGIRTMGFLCDVCQGGAGSARVIDVGAKCIESEPEKFSGLAAIFSAYAYDNALDGLFVETLVRLLRQGPSKPAIRELAQRSMTGVLRNTHFNMHELARMLEIEMQVLRSTRPSVPRPLVTLVGSDPALFPNPVRQEDQPLMNVAEQRRRHARGDVDAHFLAKARGLEPEESGWFFSGRVDVTRDIVSWLERPRIIVGESNLFVLTGDAGTGKSAVIGRLIALSDRDLRAQAGMQGWDKRQDSAEQIPLLHTIDAALHLRNLTGLQVVQLLTDLLQLQPSDDPGELASFVMNAPLGPRGFERSFRVVLDALDESEEPARIAADLLRPLAAKGWRLLVASRRYSAARGVDDLLEWLGPAHVRDLDKDTTSAAAIAQYAKRRLLETHDSPYAGSDELVDQLATLIGERADGKFLYARLVVTGVLRRGKPVDQAWLGESIAEILARDFDELDASFMSEFERGDTGATALLASLAWGEGNGLPIRDDLWPRFASAISVADPPLTEAHMLWVLREGGRFIVESTDGDQVVYRLFHQSANEYFRAQPRFADASTRTADALEAALAHSGGWEYANPYLLRHLATHLANLSDAEPLQRLLLDYDWMRTKLERLGIRALLQDYARQRAHEVPAVAVRPENTLVTQLHRVLATSAHILASDPGELPAQLIGRLLHDDAPQAVALLERAEQATRRLWLRPITASLAAERSLRSLKPADSVLAHVAFSRNGRWAVHIHESREVMLWDLEHWISRGTLFQLPTTGSSYASDMKKAGRLAISDDARVCLAPNADGTITCWRADIGVLVLGSQDQSGLGIVSTLLAIDPKGLRALSFDGYGQLDLWNVVAGTREKTWHLYPCLASFSPSGETVALAFEDGEIFLLQIASLQLKRLCVLAECPTALAWASDGSMLFVARSDGYVKRYRVADPSGLIRGLLPALASAPLLDDGKEFEMATSLALSADNEYLAVGTSLGSVEIWHAGGRKPTRYYRGHTKEVTSICFSSGETRVISADVLRLKEWALHDDANENRGSCPRTDGRIVMAQEHVQAVALLEDLQLAVWDARTGALKFSLLVPDDFTRSFGTVLSAAQRHVLAWYGGHLCIWNIRTASFASHRLHYIREAVLSADGGVVVFADESRILHWRPGSQPELLARKGGGYGHIALSPDGKLTLASDSAGEVILWELDVAPYSSAARRSLRRVWHSPGEHLQRIAFLDNTRAIVATRGGGVYIVDTADRCGPAYILGEHGPNLRSLLIAAKGRVVTGSLDSIKVWDLNRHTTTTYTKHAGILQQLSANGDRVLHLTIEGGLQIVSLYDGSLIATFHGDRRLIECAADADLEWIVALDESGQLHFLHCEHARPF